MINLYTISDSYLSILNHFHEQEGEVDQHDMHLLKQLDELHDDIQDKAINIASYLKNLDAEYSEVSKARKDMQERERRLKNKMDWLEDYLKMNLQRCGISEIRKSPNFVIKVKPCPFSVNIIDESRIPYDYKQVKEVISIDKNKIKDDLKKGVIIDGVELKQNVSLFIK